MASADEARWNEELTRILREGAEARERLERARWLEDSRMAERQAAACRALIGSLAPPARGGGRSPGSPSRHRRRGIGTTMSLENARGEPPQR